MPRDPSSDPILDAFAGLVRRRAAAPLVASPRTRLTIEDVDSLARQVMDRVLRGRPDTPPPGTLVGLASPDGAAFLASFLALRRASLVPVLLDHKSPAAERDRVIASLGCGWLLSCQRLWPRGAGDWTLSPRPAAGGGEPATLSPATAAVKLTSGSTGTPRGIVTPAEALAADDAALARSMGLAADERILATLPLSHSYGLSSVAMPALVRGSLLVMPAPDSGPFGPILAARELAATFLPTVPALLGALVGAGRPPALPESLRLTVSAGAPLPPAIAERFHAIYGRRVHVFYGSSETGGICFDRDGGAGERGAVGTPVDGVRIELEPLPGDEAEARDAGGSGRVSVRSPAVAAGYLPAGDDRLAEGRFLSGDLARWSAGELYLLGRTDDLINVRGKKVDPREVEAVVGELPGVGDVVALGAGDDGREERLRLVVACAPAALSSESVLAWCRERLAEHKVPRSVRFVAEIPRTARGKIDRRALVALAAGVPDPVDDAPPAPAAASSGSRSR